MQNQPFNPKNARYNPWSQTWKKVMMIVVGGIIGMNVLAGCEDSKPTATTKDKPSATVSAETKTDENSENSAESKPKTAKTKTAEPKAIEVANHDNAKSNSSKRDRQPESKQSDMSANATLTARSGAAIDILAGPSSSSKALHIAYNGDRVKIIDSTIDERTSWYKIHFPQSGAEGWVNRDLVEIDPDASLPSLEEKMIEADNNIPEHNQPNSGVVDEPNATITGSGSINIRSGPGTNYKSPHVAYAGDRVLVTDTADDAEGNTWYEIYFPKSKAQGWVAGHLLDTDF